MERTSQGAAVNTGGSEQARSLLEVIGSALSQLADEVRLTGVDLAWTIDPTLPAYVSVSRVDLLAIISVLVRRALSVGPDTALHLTATEARFGEVLLQLEDMGEEARALPHQQWQQLCFWVEELGGQITRASEGLLWRVTLPLDPLTAAQVNQNRAAGVRLLLVCADTDTRARVLGYLSGAAHTVIECRTQAEALEVAKNRRFDLALLDADLPDGDGLLLAEQLYQLRPTERMAFAVMVPGQPLPKPEWPWVRFWLHKPPRAAELEAALEAGSAARRANARARLAQAQALHESSENPAEAKAIPKKR